MRDRLYVPRVRGVERLILPSLKSIIVVPVALRRRRSGRTTGPACALRSRALSRYWTLSFVLRPPFLPSFLLSFFPSVPLVHGPPAPDPSLLLGGRGDRILTEVWVPQNRVEFFLAPRKSQALEQSLKVFSLYGPARL